jgi:hypothetical protein
MGRRPRPPVQGGCAVDAVGAETGPCHSSKGLFMNDFRHF